jgi:hypothetical protein
MIPIEIDGIMWNLVVDYSSAHTKTSPSGKEVIAYKAIVVAKLNEWRDSQ